MRSARVACLLAGMPLLLSLAQSSCLPASTDNVPSRNGQEKQQTQASPPQARSPERAEQAIARRVLHELRMLPYYSVFDWLVFRVDGYQVTLSGYTIRPTLKKDAEARVKRIEGVERVVNRIEVLPVSPHDDRLRRALYRTLYSQPSLHKYRNPPDPSIHIIVNGGHVTLEGVVLNEADKNIAGITARGVPGSFSVTNNLRTEN